jgi:methylamine dehydrogenase accessory protein MauD
MAAVIVRAVLAAVLVTAAAAKLTDRPSVRESLRAFGVPPWATAPAAVGLPLVELAVGGALLPASSARYGALAAAGLLAVFTAAVAYQLVRGRRPECNCFGGLQAKPIGRLTLVRNAALVGLAALAAAAAWRGPSQSLVGWLSDPLLAAIGGLSFLVLAQAALIVALLRRHGHVLAHLDVIPDDEPEVGLSVGAEAPEFALPDLDGELVTLAALLEDGLPTLLLFSDPACGACSALLPQVGRWQREHGDELTVVLVSNGDEDGNRARASEHGLTLVLRQEAHAVGLAYGANATPMAVLVDVEGRLASSPAGGGDAIRALVANVLRRAPEEVLIHG